MAQWNQRYWNSTLESDDSSAGRSPLGSGQIRPGLPVMPTPGYVTPGGGRQGFTETDGCVSRIQTQTQTETDFAFSTHPRYSVSPRNDFPPETGHVTYTCGKKSPEERSFWGHRGVHEERRMPGLFECPTNSEQEKSSSPVRRTPDTRQQNEFIRTPVPVHPTPRQITTTSITSTTEQYPRAFPPRIISSSSYSVQQTYRHPHHDSASAAAAAATVYPITFGSGTNQLQGSSNDDLSDTEPMEVADESQLAGDIETIHLRDEDPNSLPASAADALKLGAVFAQNADGDTLLHLAIMFERTEHALVLIGFAVDRDWLNLSNKIRQTPLHLAAIKRQPRVICRLLSRGAKKTVYDRNINTPLHIACKDGHLDCVQELTSISGQRSDSDAYEDVRNEIEIQNCDGQTCLHLAATNNRMDIVRYLVEERGANINLKELKRGRTILHEAVERRNHTLVQYLVNLPACFELFIDEQTYDGYTALHIAKLTRQHLIEEELMGAGAQLSMINYETDP